MNLERIILNALDLVHPRMMPTGTLWSEVRLDADEASYTEFQAALTHLERKGQVVVITGEDRNKAKITDAGRARLLE
jgi:ABC-type cobalamin transport system ATPase subunit